jgi:helicase-like protein/type III restriction/modification enzyme restriction subunit
VAIWGAMSVDVIAEIIEEENIGNERFVVIEESPIYPGQLVLLAEDQVEFRKQFSDYVSRFHILKELSLYNEFIKETQDQGRNVFLLPSAIEIIQQDSANRWPLKVAGFSLPNGGDLFAYQKYGLCKALNLVGRGTGFMFFNWGTGSGKSIAAAAGAQDLIINQKEFDIALVFTLRKIRSGLASTFANTTQLRTRVIDGTKEYRIREYAKQDADVYVLNYEKAHHDQRELQLLIRKKRVLFIFDEVQRILVWSGGKATLAAKGINALVRKPAKRVVWPMSASIINQDPARYWRVFQWAPNQPLGNLTDFRKAYQISGSALWTGQEGIRYQQVRDVWDEKKLEEVRHRIAHLTHAVRKTDPGVRELFKGIQFVPVEVELSDTDREIYEALKDEAVRSRDNNEWDRAAALVNLMKLVCNTSEALFHTSSGVAASMMGKIKSENFKTSLSAKFEMVLDKIMEIREQGDKVILFTKYTNLGLFLIGNELKRRGVNHVLHWGAGMTYNQGVEAQNKFNKDPSVTAFVSSDAGAYGLNLQVSRYVINYEIPLSYDDLMQRNSRIDRADSHLDGLTCYGYYCVDTVEERSFAVMEQRRELAQIIQGTREELSRERIAIAGLGIVNQRDEINYMLGSDK